PFSRISSWATQREALPQASTSPPSALRMCMAASVLPFFGGSITMNWSHPTPVLRSATARAWASLSANGCARASMTTKSLQPVHLDEGAPAHGRVIRPRHRPSLPSVPAAAESADNRKDCELDHTLGGLRPASLSRQESRKAAVGRYRPDGLRRRDPKGLNLPAAGSPPGLLPNAAARLTLPDPPRPPGRRRYWHGAVAGWRPPDPAAGDGSRSSPAAQSNVHNAE